MPRGDLAGGGAPPEPAPPIAGVDVDSVLGTGPAGTVWRAHDGKRVVALKVARPGGPFDPDLLAQCVSSSDGSVSHPNILEVFASGRTEDGTVWWTMPLRDGDSIERITADLRRGQSAEPSLTPLAIGPGGELHSEFEVHAAALFADLADGLAVAHAAGIVHGRLHGRNLLFAPSGRIVISDFGGAEPETSAEGDTRDLGKILAEVLSAARGAGLSEIPAALSACIDKATTTGYDDAGALAADLGLFVAGRRPAALAERESARLRDESESGEATGDANAERERAVWDVERARLETESREAERLRQKLERSGEERRHFEKQLEERELEGRREGREDAAQTEERAREFERELELERGRRARSDRELTVERRRAERREIEILHLKEELPEDAAPAASREASPWSVYVTVAAVVVAGILGVWAGIETYGRGATERRAVEVATRIESGDFAGARERARETATARPSDGVARATASLVEAVLDTAAVRDGLGEDLAKAVEAASRREPAEAADQVRSTLANSGGLGAAAHHDLETLADHLDKEAARDLTVEGLESSDDAERLLALQQLEHELRIGRRPAGDVKLALRVLDPASPEVFRRALPFVAPATGTAVVLEHMGVGTGQPDVQLSRVAFEVLLAELERAHDDVARQLLASWGLSERRALDEATRDGAAASTPSEVRLPPNVIVRVDSASPRDHVERWIAWSARHDTAALLDAAPDLFETTRLVPAVLDGLAAFAAATDVSDSRRSRAVRLVRDLALRDPIRGGQAAVETLARMGAELELLELAETRSCPVAMRRAAIEEMPLSWRPSTSPSAWRGLRRLVATEPEVGLRQAAFHIFEGSEAPDAIRALPDLVADPDLREPALAWLRRLPPESCVEEAIALLRHPKGSVRREAVAVLHRVDDPRLLLPLTARLFEPDPGVRAAALELLRAKAGTLRVGGRPEHVIVLFNDLLRRFGYPFRQPDEEQTPESAAVDVLKALGNGLRASFGQAAETLGDRSRRASWIHRVAEELREVEREPEDDGE